MAKCLRCGAGNEWLQGNVPVQVPLPAKRVPTKVENELLNARCDELQAERDRLNLQNDELRKALERIRDMGDGMLMRTDHSTGSLMWFVAHDALEGLTTKRKHADE